MGGQGNWLERIVRYEIFEEYFVRMVDAARSKISGSREIESGQVRRCSRVSGELVRHLGQFGLTKSL